MPRWTSTVMKPQTLTPERFFQLSPRPRVVVFLARARDRAERPHQLAGVDVPRATSPAGPCGGFSCVRAAGDDQVLVHDRRRAQTVVAGQALQDLGRIQIDDALVAEGLVGLAGLRVERDRAGRRPCRRRSAAASCVARPVLDAASRRDARRHLIDPDLLAGRRIERDDAAVCGVVMYITPSMTSGVVPLTANPEPRPRPRPAVGGGAGAPPAAAPAACDRPTPPSVRRRSPASALSAARSASRRVVAVGRPLGRGFRWSLVRLRVNGVVEQCRRPAAC